MKQESHLTRATANSRTRARTSCSGSWLLAAMVLARSCSKSKAGSWGVVVVSINKVSGPRRLCPIAKADARDRVSRRYFAEANAPRGALGTLVRAWRGAVVTGDTD